ncbi:MAG: hypothetical protein IKH11_06200 [Bacteroidales bacterium]|nr:hypothetical protein [Bacteroidales bacterium]
MRHFTRLFLLLFLLFPMHGPLRSQDYPSWDALLDRYERICRMCLELKDSDAFSGSFEEVLAELESLKEEFKGARDRMPAVARRRYELIRSMYAHGTVSDTRPQPSPPECEPLSLTPPARMLAKFPGGPVRVAGKTPDIYYRYTVSASALVAPEFTPGIKLQWLDGKIGAYAGIYSNFSVHKASYQALSNGTADGFPVWTSGVSALDRLFVTAGPAFRLTGRLSMYCGIGYGHRRIFWEDSEGLWMDVVDAGRRGLCTELGANYHIGHFSLGAGWLGLPFSYNALSFSVGYAFGRRYLKQ